MNCYFDLLNFKEFSKQTVEVSTQEQSMSCLKMLKKNFDIIINETVYEELEEEYQILLEEFQSGFEGNLTFVKNFKRNIAINDSLYLGSIILLDDVDLTNSLKTKNQILVGSLKEETETLSSLILDDQGFHKEEQIGKDITPALYININHLPISKIFIIDRYLFKGPEVGGNLGLFEYNIEKLLKNILYDRRSRIDIILVYQIHNKTIPNTNKDYDNGPEKQKIVNKIKNLVHKHCPKPNICMIAVPKGKIDDEHDRHIITDYLRIKSGDSFAYFKSNGDIASKSLFVDFYSHGKKSYKINSDVLMSKINTYTNECIDKYASESYIPKDYNQKDLIVF